MALVSYSKINIYEPDFDIISGLNIDKCPFIRNSRNNPMYKCLCNNQTFTNFSSFQSHIKLKTHEIWMVNCTDYFNELNSYKKEIERLSNENIKKDKIISKTINDYETLLKDTEIIKTDIKNKNSDFLKNKKYYFDNIIKLKNDLLIKDTEIMELENKLLKTNIC
tara:strand:+ start:961 stop:1455 length:495 start_codon:yes stop_codon:yes gene_type:complete